MIKITWKRCRFTIKFKYFINWFSSSHKENKENTQDYKLIIIFFDEFNTLSHGIGAKKNADLVDGCNAYEKFTIQKW